MGQGVPLGAKVLQSVSDLGLVVINWLVGAKCPVAFHQLMLKHIDRVLSSGQVVRTVVRQFRQAESRQPLFKGSF